MDDQEWQLQRLFHINITCRDLAKSIAFYQKLGFVVRNFVNEQSFDASGEYSSAMGLPPNAKFRGCLLHSPGQRGHALLDLIEWIDPPTPETSRVLGNSPGIPRIALWITNLTAAYVQLAQDGIEFEGLLGRPDRENGIEHVAFARDPDGLIVELLEFPSD